ncbi:MAG: OsmC family protein [Bryobacteraceae bacterium]
MIETTIQYLGGVKFEATARGHSVICDQPVDNGGADEGMTPPEFLLASLGTCAGFYAAQYLKARNLSTMGLSVRVTAEKAAQPARLGSFHIEVEAPGAVDTRHSEGVLRAVKSCLVHNTLMLPPSIELNVNAAVPVTASH